MDCLLNRFSSFDQIFILFVLEINFCLVNEYKYTSYWLNSKDFSVFVKYGLEDNEGDYWEDPELIACAMEDNEVVVVSQESSRKHPQRKIPYVYEQLGIRCIKSLEFLKEILYSCISITNYSLVINK